LFAVVVVQLVQKLVSSRRIVLDALKRRGDGGASSSNKLTSSDSSDAGGSGASRLTTISALFDRLRYVTQYSYTLLRDQLNHVRHTARTHV